MESICTKLKAYLKGDFSSGMDDVIEQLAEFSMDLNEDLRGMKSPNEKIILLKGHLEKAVDLSSHVTLKINDFSEGKIMLYNNRVYYKFMTIFLQAVINYLNNCYIFRSRMVECQ